MLPSDGMMPGDTSLPSISKRISSAVRLISHGAQPPARASRTYFSTVLLGRKVPGNLIAGRTAVSAVKRHIKYDHFSLLFYILCPVKPWHTSLGQQPTMRRLLDAFGGFTLFPALMPLGDDRARLAADDLEFPVAAGIAHHFLLANDLSALRARPDRGVMSL